jgi:hypothetical protein
VGEQSGTRYRLHGQRASGNIGNLRIINNIQAETYSKRLG